MSKLESSKVFPTVVFIIFVLLIATGAYFSGAPSAPKMPGVKVIASPVIQAPAVVAEDAKNESETPPSNDAESAEPTATVDPNAQTAPAVTQPAPATGGGTSWQ